MRALVRQRRRIATTVVPLLTLGLLGIGGVGGLGGAARATTPPFAPISHMLVLMQENRSFDNYLGQLHAYQVAKYGSSDVEAEPATGNLDPSGNVIVPFQQTSYCEVEDLNHSWSGTHTEWDNGLMDNFAKVNAASTNSLGQQADPTGRRAMGYYDQTDLPFYYDLYDKLAMSDTYFSSALTQTFPNRFYLLAGTSFGHTANDFATSPSDWAPPNGTIFDSLDAARSRGGCTSTRSRLRPCSPTSATTPRATCSL
jgi:phospholipase C